MKVISSTEDMRVLYSKCAEKLPEEASWFDLWTQLYEEIVNDGAFKENEDFFVTVVEPVEKYSAYFRRDQCILTVGHTIQGIQLFGEFDEDVKNLVDKAAEACSNSEDKELEEKVLSIFKGIMRGTTCCHHGSRDIMELFASNNVEIDPNSVAHAFSKMHPHGHSHFLVIEF